MTFRDVELIAFEQKVDKEGNGNAHLRFRIWFKDRERSIVRVAEYPITNWIHNVDQMTNGIGLPKRIHDGVVPYLLRNFGQTQRKLGEVQRKWLIKHTK